jgi:hypothetical protein
MRRKKKNLFEQLIYDRYADQSDWVPNPCKEPTKTKRGSVERIEAYAERLEQGVELWHENDTMESCEIVRSNANPFRRRPNQ